GLRLFLLRVDLGLFLLGLGLRFFLPRLSLRSTLGFRRLGLLLGLRLGVRLHALFGRVAALLRFARLDRDTARVDVAADGDARRRHDARLLARKLDDVALCDLRDRRLRRLSPALLLPLALLGHGTFFLRGLAVLRTRSGLTHRICIRLVV